jgi:hypothetical protein
VSEQRYFIDERSGCVAVRDRTLTDPDYNGLHNDTEGVVFYRHGRQVRSTCPTCCQSVSKGWEVAPEDLAAAHAECERLNANAHIDLLAMGV